MRDQVRVEVAGVVGDFLPEPTGSLECLIFTLELDLCDDEAGIVPLEDVDPHTYVDDLAGMSLTDIKALALDPDERADSDPARTQASGAAPYIGRELAVGDRRPAGNPQ